MNPNSCRFYRQAVLISSGPARDWPKIAFLTPSRFADVGVKRFVHLLLFRASCDVVLRF